MVVGCAEPANIVANTSAASRVYKSVEQTLPLQCTVASRATRSTGDLIGDLFDLHQARLYRLALGMTCSHDEALDLVQETFLRALRTLRAGGKFPCADHGPEAAEASLVRALVNLCRDRWRRLAVRKRHPIAAPAVYASSHETAWLAHAAVHRALEQLPPRQRAIVVLRELEGASTQAVAALLGLRQATVRWHLSRARRQLRQQLSGGGSTQTFVEEPSDES